VEFTNHVKNHRLWKKVDKVIPVISCEARRISIKKVPSKGSGVKQAAMNAGKKEKKKERKSIKKFGRGNRPFFKQPLAVGALAL
jgi:hypothetical protein